MTPCPSEKQLRTWLAGGLSEAESQAIEAHVETCPNVCQPLLDSFSGFEDDLPSGARIASETRGSTAASAVAPAARTPAPRTADVPNLPGYDILCQLGKGGMGVVFKARHRRMDRLVAIKVLPALVMQNPDAIARFEREVKAAARLQHPNIVAAYDAAEANGIHFLVMEYVEGENLAALVRHKGPFWVSRAVDCVLQAARGLDYAHRHGIIHRDVKPSNLLLDGEGVVKVLDMGLARFETAGESDLTELTGMGQIMGTVDYMAPEQALDTRHADARSDIYSLGVTLWYLLTGRPAFFGENALARLLAHREQPIPSLVAACPAATPSLEAVFMKMVAKRPQNRYQTMSDVITALEDCRRAAADEKTFSWPTSEDGLPRPSHDVGGTAGSAVPGATPQPHPQAGTRAVLHAAPSVEATLTLNAAEFDTDPNTEQSLDVSASALTRPPRRGRKFGIAAALLGLAALLAAAIVIRIQTGQGEVIVESEVDGISLDILRNGEPVKDDWQIHAGADNRWHVRTGNIEVKLPANLQGEFTLNPDTARLVRDGTIVVKITRTKSHEGPAVVTEDRDRAAAEWVLAQGGKVSYITATGEVPTSSVRDLPTTPFQIHTADLWGAKTVNNEDLERFAGLTRLEYCWLDETDLDADAIARLARIPRLRGLGVSGTRIKSSQLAGLAALRSLDHIELKAGDQIDDDWTAVRQLPALRQLRLYEATSDDVRRLGRVSRLRTIFLPAAHEDEVAELQAANPLCRVLIGGGDVRYRAMGRDPESELARRLLAGRAALSLTLAGQGGKATADDLSAGKPVCICSIELKPEVSLAADDLDHLSCSAATLVDFFAHGATGADRYATALAENGSLANVEFTNSDLSDTGLDHLRRLASLATLDVQGTKVTGAGVQKLHAALPRCRILSDHGTIEPERRTEGK